MTTVIDSGIYSAPAKLTRLAFQRRRVLGMAALLGLAACGGGTGDRSGQTSQSRLVLFGESHARRWADDNASTLARWNVTNRGVGGETTDRGLQRLPDALALRPDLLVHWQGGNDAIRYNGLHEPSYRAALQLMAGSGVPCLVLTIPPIYRNASENAASLRVAEAQRKLVAEAGLAMFDVSPLIDTSLMLDDGLHLNSDGYALLSQRLGWL